MLAYNELKPGVVFIKDGQPFEVIESLVSRMQMAKAVAQLKIKNLKSGKIINYTAHQNETFEEAEIETEPAQFLYYHRDEFWFQDPVNPKKRFYLKEAIIGDYKFYLKPNSELKIIKFKNEIINIQLPIKIDLKVIEAPPALRGDTAQGGTKIVTLETGLKVNVPLFIKEGDIIKINTKTGKYVERV